MRNPNIGKGNPKSGGKALTVIFQSLDMYVYVVYICICVCIYVCMYVWNILEMKITLTSSKDLIHIQREPTAKTATVR